MKKEVIKQALIEAGIFLGIVIVIDVLLKVIFKGIINVEHYLYVWLLGVAVCWVKEGLLYLRDGIMNWYRFIIIPIISAISIYVVGLVF